MEIDHHRPTRVLVQVKSPAQSSTSVILWIAIIQVSVRHGSWLRTTSPSVLILVVYDQPVYSLALLSILLRSGHDGLENQRELTAPGQNDE